MKYKYNNEWVDVNIKALDSMEIGSIIAFAGETIPTGWLECNGATITQSAYPELYDLIGGTLPNLKGKTIVGQDTSDTDFDTLGETGGSKTDNMSNAFAKMWVTNNRLYWTEETSPTWNTNYEGNDGDLHKKSGSISSTKGVGIVGSVSTLQPYAVYKWIIKAKQTTPTMASVVNTTNNSTTDAYSCNYINGEVLYYNASGSNSDITLSDSAENYKRIKILYKSNDDYYNSVEVEEPNDKKVNFLCVYHKYNETGFYMKNKVMKILGTSMSIYNNQYGETSISSSGTSFNNNNYIYITKVIGYK